MASENCYVCWIQEKLQWQRRHDFLDLYCPVVNTLVNQEKMAIFQVDFALILKNLQKYHGNFGFFGPQKLPF